VDHEGCVRVHLALFSCHEDDRAHGCGEVAADCADGAGHRAQYVVDGESRTHLPAGAADEEGDGGGGVLSFEEQHVLAQSARHQGLDLAGDDEGAFAQ